MDMCNYFNEDVFDLITMNFIFKIGESFIYVNTEEGIFVENRYESKKILIIEFL